MTKIEVKRERKDGWDVFQYVGPMNEEAGIHLLPLYDAADKKCVFNFRGLTSVNSKGISIWMNFIRDFRDGRQVAMEECPDCLVQQLNMIPSLTANIEIRSIHAPYNCGSCGGQSTRLVKVERNSATFPASAQRASCEKCRSPMEMEEDPDDYFLFLTWKTGRS